MPLLWTPRGLSRKPQLITGTPQSESWGVWDQNHGLMAVPGLVPSASRAPFSVVLHSRAKWQTRDPKSSTMLASPRTRPSLLKTKERPSRLPFQQQGNLGVFRPGLGSFLGPLPSGLL